MPEIDIDRVRSETLGCSRVIHFNNAGASLMPDPVFNAVQDHLQLERCIGGYEAQEENQDKYNRFYTAFSELFNCQPDEIAYVENATRAWDMAFYSVPFEPGDRILTGQSEYVSNYLAMLQIVERKGVIVDIVPDDDCGQIDLVELEAMIDDRVRLIALTHVPTQGGLVNPAIEVGRVARKHNVFYLLDACQSAGQIPIDVQKIGCDMLSATGRKYLRGPRGTGVLYVRRPLIERLVPPFIDLRSAQWHDAESYTIRKDARRFENWESFVAGRIGLARAVDYALEIGIKEIWQRTRRLGQQLRKQLGAKHGIQTHDLGERKCGIVTFSKKGESPFAIEKRMRSRNINVNVAQAQSARLDMSARRLDAIVRASIHYFNTESEIDRFCDEL